MVSYYELIAEDRGIRFESSGDFRAVLGDDSLLQRLFANLTSNAVYYAASDSLITIAASTVVYNSIKTAQKNKPAASESRYLKIVLTNQLEHPLTQIEVDKLSERFYRHHKDHTLHSGTGLGLSIVQAIVKAHNGKISITVKDSYCFQVSVALLIY